MPFVPDTVAPDTGRFVPDAAPTTGRFVPDKAPDATDQFSPAAQVAAGAAAAQSIQKTANMRNAQDWQGVPQPTYLDDAAMTGLRVVPPMLIGGAAALAGPEMLALAPAAAALGNRAAHVYAEKAGLANPQPFNEALREDAGIGAVQTAGMMVPGANLPFTFAKRMASPLLTTGAETAANMLVQGGTGAGLSAIYQALNTGDVDPKEVAAMGGTQAFIAAMMHVVGSGANVRDLYASRNHLVEVAQKLGAPVRNYDELGQWIEMRKRQVAVDRARPVTEAGPEPQATSTAPLLSDVSRPALPEPTLPLPTDTPPAELAVVGKAHVDTVAESLAAANAGVSPDELRIRQLAANLMGRTPDQASKALRAEAKLTEDQDKKASLIAEADRLENVAKQQEDVVAQQTERQAAIENQTKQAQEAQAKVAAKQAIAQLPQLLAGKTPQQQLEIFNAAYSAHQDALTPDENQQAIAMRQNLEAAANQQKQQEQVAKQQQGAVQEQQKVAEDAQKAMQLVNPKPMVLANSAAQTAKNIEDQPGTAQAQLNQLAQPAQPVPALPNPQPIGGTPNAVQVQGANAQVLRQPAGQSQDTLALPKLGGGNAQPQVPARAGQEAPLAGPRNPAVSTGTGVPTPRETQILDEMSRSIIRNPEAVLKKNDPEKLDYLKEQLAAKELSPEDYAVRVQESAAAFAEPKKVPATSEPAKMPERSWEAAQAAQEEARNSQEGVALKKAADIAEENFKDLHKKIFDEKLDYFTKHVEPELKAKVTDDSMKQIVMMSIQNDPRLIAASASQWKARDSYEKFLDTAFQSRAPLPVPPDSQIQPPKTKAFEAWFKGSKAVDKSGHPLVVFHGTFGPDFQFIKTEREHTGSLKNSNHSGALGAWFTAKAQNAGEYDAGNAEDVASIMAGEKSGSRVIPAYLRILKPMEFEGYEDMMDYRDEIKGWQKMPEAGWLAVKAKLKKEGYDGIVIRDSSTDGDVFRDDWVAFNSDQIKNALENPAKESGPIVPPGTPYNPPQGEAPPPDNREARQKGSQRRQQRGAASTSAVGSMGGAVAGAAYGYISADPKRKDETEEQYQSRVLYRTIMFGLGGGIAGYSASKVFGRPSVTASRALAAIKSEAVGIENMPPWYVKFRQSAPVMALRERVNNNFVRVKEMVANAALSGHIITDDINPYSARKTYGGRIAEQFRKIDDQMGEIQKVVVDTAKAAGVPTRSFIDHLNIWLEAGHTPAYNAWLAHQWAANGNEGPAPTGRLTDEEAKVIRDTAREKGLEPAFKDIEKLYNNVRDVTREVMVNGGLITQETLDAWKKQFPNWVPFNRDITKEDFDQFVVNTIGGGPGLNALGSGVRHYGEDGSTLPISDIAGNLLANYKDAVQRVMKSELQYSAANFFRSMEAAGTPVPGVEVRRPKVIGASGDKPVYERFDPEHMVSYMKEGKPTWIIFQDSALARAFGNTNSDAVPAFLRFIGTPTRLLSRAYTQYNINWLLPNVVRDKQSAAWKLISQGDVGGAANMLNPVTAATDSKAVVDWIYDRKTQGSQHFQSLLDNGGLSGGFASSTRDKAQRMVEKMRQADTNKAVWGLQATKEFFQLMSEISEGSTRLRAYNRALALGATPREAAVASLNSSVDFNQRGTWTPTMSQLWTFVNPSLQGGANATKNILRNPHSAVVIASGLAALAVAVGDWNKAFIPDWKQDPALAHARTNGIPLIYSVDKSGKANYFVVPISQEMRPVKAAVDFFTDLGQGDLHDRNQLEQEAARVGTALMAAASPFPTSTNPATMVMPSALRPGLEVAANTNYWGGPIVPPFQQIDPLLQEHGKYSPRSLDQRTGKAAIAMTDALHDHLGLEVSPDKMRYLMNGYLGGWANLAGSVVNATSMLPESMGGSKQTGEFTPADIPGAGGFFKTANIQGKPNPLESVTQDIAERTHTNQLVAGTQLHAFFNQNFSKADPKDWGKIWQDLAKQGLIPADKQNVMKLLGWMQSQALETDRLDGFIKGIPAGQPRGVYYYWVIKEYYKNDLKAAQKFVNEQVAKKNLVGSTAQYLQAYLKQGAPAKQP